jgi:hypothetical protein
MMEARICRFPFKVAFISLTGIHASQRIGGRHQGPSLPEQWRPIDPWKTWASSFNEEAENGWPESPILIFQTVVNVVSGRRRLHSFL